MARKVVVEMVDDIDGTVFGEDGESIHYAVDGVEYVIDLKDEHAKELLMTLGESAQTCSVKVPTCER